MTSLKLYLSLCLSYKPVSDYLLSGFAKKKEIREGTENSKYILES